MTRSPDSSLLRVHPRVISFARLNPIAILGFHLDAAEGAIVFRVHRCVADAVLASQLVRDLLEGLTKLVRLANRDFTASGFLGPLAHIVHVRAVAGCLQQTNVANTL